MCGIRPREDLRTRCQNAMTDRIHEPNNQPQDTKRANLFHLLQKLVVQTGAGGPELAVEAPFSDEQIETYQRQNGIVS
jgi:hypothetical protein